MSREESELELEASLRSRDAPSQIASERVERPEPGLARGRWEAPPQVFYAVAAMTIVGSVTLAIRGLRKPRR